MPDRGTIRVRNADHVARSIAQTADAMRRAGARALSAGAMELVRDVKLELSRPGTGRLYPRAPHAGHRDHRGRYLARGAGTMHQASAPGEPPAVDTGQLRNSIEAERVQSDTGRIAWRVGTNDERAPSLEFGTLGTGGHIAPRPFLRVAIARWRPKFVQLLRTTLVAALRGRAAPTRAGSQRP